MNDIFSARRSIRGGGFRTRPHADGQTGLSPRDAGEWYACLMHLFKKATTVIVAAQTVDKVCEPQHFVGALSFESIVSQAIPAERSSGLCCPRIPW